MKLVNSEGKKQSELQFLVSPHSNSVLTFNTNIIASKKFLLYFTFKDSVNHRVRRLSLENLELPRELKEISFKYNNRCIKTGITSDGTCSLASCFFMKTSGIAKIFSMDNKNKFFLFDLTGEPESESQLFTIEIKWNDDCQYRQNPITIYLNVRCVQSNVKNVDLEKMRQNIKAVLYA